MTDFDGNPLGDFGGVADRRLVAVGPTGEYDGAALARAAAAVAARLAGRCRGGDWGVFAPSPVTLLAALTAIQAAGARAVLLPHVQPALLRSLAADIDGLLVPQDSAVAQVPSSRPVVTLPPLEELLRAEPGSDALPLTAWSMPVGFLTSGSSGARTCVYRTPAELVAEAGTLETAFGAAVGPSRLFCGTTSHQHLYGFTFRVIWPFLTQRPLADGQVRIPGEVAQTVRRHGRVVLISSPAFLSRARRLIDFGLLEAESFIGFSSGGALDAAVATTFNARRNVRLVEIYGSTETGAVASREVHDRGDTPWRALPGVTVAQAGELLQASGPHVPGGMVTTEDRIARRPEGFSLLGRRDRIVKVADKRISLTELERRLLTLPAVAEARVLLLPGNRLGGVVVPVTSSWPDIRRQGKGAFCRRLRDHLCEDIDRATTPKRWRLVKCLPRDAQSKVELAALAALFVTPAAAGAEGSRIAPLGDTVVAGGIDWHTAVADAGRWVGAASVPADLPELDGHFPGAPIVPGVAQLGWATQCARQVFGLDSLSGTLEAVKFRRPIKPGAMIRLELRLDPPAAKVHLTLSDDDHTYCTGRLVIA